MTSVARTRIGRVTMKAGGADLRVLHPRKTEKISRHMRDFADALDEDGDPPDAYVAVAYWEDKDEPWRADYQISWDTKSAIFAHSVVFERASALLAVEGGAQIAEDRVLRKLGYKPDDAS